MTEKLCTALIGTGCIIMYIILFCYLIQAFTGFNPLWLLVGGII